MKRLAALSFLVLISLALITGCATDPNNPLQDELQQQLRATGARDGSVAGDIGIERRHSVFRK